LYFNYLGQQYTFQQFPTQGEWFVDKPFAAIVAEQWQQPDSLAWPAKN
jgi:hypothetical protein